MSLRYTPLFFSLLSFVSLSAMDRDSRDCSSGLPARLMQVQQLEQGSHVSQTEKLSLAMELLSEFDQDAHDEIANLQAQLGQAELLEKAGRSQAAERMKNAIIDEIERIVDMPERIEYTDESPLLKLEKDGENFRKKAKELKRKLWWRRWFCCCCCC